MRRWEPLDAAEQPLGGESVLQCASAILDSGAAAGAAPTRANQRRARAAQQTAEFPDMTMCGLQQTPTCVALAKGGSVLVVGFADGRVHVKSLLEGARGGRDHRVTCVHAHRATVEAVVLLDCGLVVSSASDGGLVVQRLGDISGTAAPKFEEQTLPLSSATAATTHRPITGPAADSHLAAQMQLLPLKAPATADLPPNCPSIESARLADQVSRAEDAAAESRKGLEDRVASVLARHAALSARNMTLPPRLRLTAAELDPLPALSAQLLKEAIADGERERVRQAHANNALEQAVKCLLDEYVASVEIDRVVLRAFRAKVSVASLRTRALTARQQACVAAVREVLESSSGMNHASGDRSTGRHTAKPGQHHATGDDLHLPSVPHVTTYAAAGESEDDADEAMGHAGGAEGSGAEAGTALAAVERTEARRRARQKHDAALQRMLALMPDPNADDEEDLHVVEAAQGHMGELRLKSDPTYVTNDDERVTAERKLRQIVLLDDAVHQLMLEFNERFIALHTTKSRLTEALHHEWAQVEADRTLFKLLGGSEQDIQAALALTAADVEPGQPILDVSLVPPDLTVDPAINSILVVTEADLAIHAVEVAAEDRRRARQQAASKGWGAALAGAAGDDAGSDAGTSVAKGAPRIERESDAGGTRISGERGHARSEVGTNMGGPAQHQRRGKAAVDWHRKAEEHLREQIAAIPRSQLEREEAGIHVVALGASIAARLRNVAEVVTDFDNAVAELSDERLRLSVDLKRAECKRLLLVKELMLLREYREREQELNEALIAKSNEHAGVLQEIAACQETLQQRRVQVEQLLSEETALTSAFQQAVHDAKPFEDYLVRMYRRRLRGAVVNEESDDDKSSSSDDEDDGEDEPAPPGLDLEVYERVLMLRSDRMAHESRIHEFTKAVDDLKKSNESFAARQNALEKEVTRLQAELGTYRNDVQRRVNALHSAFALRFHQIQCIDSKSRSVPRGLTDVIAFTNTGLAALARRVEQLTSQRAILDAHFGELRHSHAQLAKQRALKQQRLQEAEHRVTEVQLLKFGQRVNLELLEDISVDRETEALRATLRNVEARADVELRQWDERIDAAKEELAAATAENSRHLQQLAVLKSEQQSLESKLDAAHSKVLGRMTQTSTVATSRDRVQLEDLVLQQQLEVDALRSEVAMLCSKGGYKYTPAFPEGSIPALTAPISEEGRGSPDGGDDHPPLLEQGEDRH